MAGPQNYPYYIVTPDYKTSSLGIQVMHYLCHLLNEKGHQAWLVNARPNPEWNTPLLNDKILNSHRSQGITGISVYPEIVSGNPLKTPVVARYMLNREGVMNGNTIDAGPNDLFFWYRSEFAEKNVDPLLRLELYNLDLFCDDNPVKDINLLYLNRIPESLVDFSALPEDIEILSMRNPLSLEQLAVKLKRARVLYTYESSGTNALAILCGCPVVALAMKGLEKYAITPATLKDTGATGYAWDDKPETLARVRETMGDLRKQMLARREQSQLQLAHFIEKTQAQASKCWQEYQSTLLQQWVMHRQLPAQHPSWVASTSLPQLLIVIHLHKRSEEQLLITLQSIAAQQVDADVMIVLPNGMNTDVFVGMQVINEGDFPATLFSIVKGEKYDWVQNIVAGVAFSSGSLAVLLSFLSVTDAQAVAGDELWLGRNNQSWHLSRKYQDWELYIRSPHIYMTRWVISCRAINALLEETVAYSPIFDSELVFKLHTMSKGKNIAYIDDILMLVESNTLTEQELKMFGRMVEAQLVNAGYQHSRVEVTTQNLLKIKYHHPEQPLVSVIILAGDQLIKLQNSITGFLEKNSWRNFELLVINHQNNASAINQWLDGLATIDPTQIRVLHPDIDNNPVLLHKFATENARGSYFLFLDKDLIFVTSDWLAHLMEQAQCCDVGCVGPKLINKEQKIVSAGVGFNNQGTAEHIGKGLIWHSLIGHAQLLSVFQPAFLDEHCWLVSRTCWENVNVLNKLSSIPGLAAADFMYRAQKLGFKVITASDSILVFDGEAQVFSFQLQSALQQMRDECLDDSERGNNGNSTLNGFSVLTINEQKQHSRWIAQQQAGIPLFITVGESGAGAYARQFSHFLAVLQKKNKIRIIHCDAMPTLQDLCTWKPDHIVVLSDMPVPDDAFISKLKANINVHIYRVAEGALSNKTLASWLHLSSLDGWLTYTIEQADWLKKRKQAVVEVTALFEQHSPGREGTDISRSLRVICDTRFLVKRETDFLASIIQRTAKSVVWLVYGDCPNNWHEAIHEIYRLRSEHSEAENIAMLCADVAVFPRLMDGSGHLRDDYGQLLYLSNNVRIICNRSKDLSGDYDAYYTTTDPDDWVKVILAIAEEKKNEQPKGLYRQVEFNHKNVLNDNAVDEFLNNLMPKKMG